MKFGGELTPKTKRQFSTSPAVKLKLDKWPHRKIHTDISSIVQCFCLGWFLIHAILSISNPGLVLIGQNLFILGSNLAVFSRISSLVVILSMTRESPLHHYGEPLGTGDCDCYTHWYQLCNTNSPVISTQHCSGKRIIIPWHDCNSFHHSSFKSA